MRLYATVCHSYTMLISHANHRFCVCHCYRICVYYRASVKYLIVNITSVGTVHCVEYSAPILGRKSL